MVWTDEIAKVSKVIHPNASSSEIPVIMA